MPSVGSGQEEESVCDKRGNPYALVANGQTWRKHGENTGGDKGEALVGAMGEMGEGAAAAGGGGRNVSPNGELRNLKWGASKSHFSEIRVRELYRSGGEYPKVCE